MNFNQFSIATLHLVHADIAGFIGACDLPAPLCEAALYAMTNGGKRVRPLLVAATFLTLHPALRKKLATSNPLDFYLPSSVRRSMVAVECLHGYSLVHDDLPCMDDDALRRGRPTTHIAYNEATALLVGDVLQTLAFEAFSHVYFGKDEFKEHFDNISSVSDTPNPLQNSLATFDKLENLARRTDVIAVTQSTTRQKNQKDHTSALLATFAPRARRMVMGQMLDLNGEHQQLNQDELETIHRDKTGALIEASILMGAICGNATEGQMIALQNFAENIGLAFQVQDDILDVTATTEALGKPSGSDEKLDKSTYVKLLGVDQATAYAESLFDTAKTALNEAFDKDNLLLDLANWLWTRQK